MYAKLTSRFINIDLTVKIAYKYAKIDVFQHLFGPYLCRVKRDKSQIMKNVFIKSKKVILILATVATVMGYVYDTDKIILKDAKKVAFVLSNVKQGKLLSNKDSNGSILYKESIEKDGVYYEGYNSVFGRLGISIL
ncbi:hypothetical protein H7U19_15355 [Hyunsoonleella sp. SJ7]|uniref:Uncharacterized protein n=1 Tax=Hyunsoonleella aquatilis TaxID=2762758 RepID=A0A923KJ75_9FLAO|nr:hypothetical protein [Hyunsoonleella aquatilis]MBC3759789.1 hypothetical protein [Hyunsoonleella aquatilis]